MSGKVKKILGNRGYSMSDSLIIKSDLKEKFSTLPNALINDGRMSAEHLGLIVYLLSKPNDWVVRVSELRKRFDYGRDKVYRILQQLEQYGYVSREQIKVDGKFSEIRYNVSDIPFPEKPYTEKPYPRNPTLTKEKDILNKDNTNLPKKKKVEKMLLIDYQLDDSDKQYAIDKGLDWEEILEDIRLWNEKNGNKASYASCKAFWQQWCRSEAKKPQRASKSDSWEDKSKVVSTERKMISLNEWRKLSDTMKDYYRRHRPDVMASITQELNVENSKDIKAS